MTDDLFKAMRQSVIDGDSDAAAELARQALAAGTDPLAAIDEGFVPGIHHVGEQFRCGEMYLPDMMLAARAMQRAIGILEPEMLARSAQRKVLGRVVIGTAKGDIHEIGKNLPPDAEELLRYDRTRTNREYLRTVSDSPELAQPLAEVIEVFDNVWYGYHEMDEASFKHYSDRVEELKEKKG